MLLEGGHQENAPSYRGTERIMIKRVAVLAAMAIFAGGMISATGPAQANRMHYSHCMQADVRTYPGGPSDGTVSVWVSFLTSESGASVVAHDITVENQTSHEIVVDVDRWQAADGNPLYRGPGAYLNVNDPSPTIWWPGTEANLYINFAKDPFVHVHFYAKSRPALEGSVTVSAKPVGPDDECSGPSR
jgi:hypothetical protein